VVEQSWHNLGCTAVRRSRHNIWTARASVHKLTSLEKFVFEHRQCWGKQCERNFSCDLLQSLEALVRTSCRTSKSSRATREFVFFMNLNNRNFAFRSWSLTSRAEEVTTTRRIKENTDSAKNEKGYR
jgi:hypothetical protein